MGKTREMKAVNSGLDGEETWEQTDTDAAERLTTQLARVRAKFGTDPAVAPRSLEAAWTSPTAVMEEDEAEFIDALADCLGAGLPLEAALACWDNGDLAYDAAADDDEPVELIVVPIAAKHSPGGRRFLVR